jgi:ribose transport system substrate-binding protein
MRIGPSLHIGFAINDTRESVWAFMEQGATEQAHKLGLQISVISAHTREEHSGVIHQLIRQQVDALIIASLGDVTPDCEAGRAAGIPVITCEIGNTDRTAGVFCDVRQDLRRGAELATDYLAQQLQGRGTLLHFAAPNSRLRTKGFYDALANYPEIQIVEGMGDWTEEGSKGSARELLATHPDIQAIFAHSDRMALGIVEVIEEIDRTGQILVAGVDATPKALQAVHRGSMAATVNTMAHVTGQLVVETAWRVLNGEDVPLFIDTPVQMVTAHNVTDVAIEELTMLPQIIRALANSNLTQRRLQEETIAMQYSIIQELSTPIIPISSEIIVMPLIGTIDSHRAQGIMSVMLQAIERSSVKVVMMDITGVHILDTSVANHLLQSAQAARLLGVQVILVGIKPEVAHTIVQLGIDLSSIITQGTLQLGIEYARMFLAKAA